VFSLFQFLQLQSVPVAVSEVPLPYVTKPLKLKFVFRYNPSVLRCCAWHCLQHQTWSTN